MFSVGKGCRKSVVHLCSYCRLIHGRPLYPSARFRKTLPWQHESTTSSSPFSTSVQKHLSKDDSSVGKPEESHSSSIASIDSTSDTSPQLRMNAINIQMLSKNLHQRIFNRKASSRSKVKQATETKNDELLEKTKQHLENHRLWGKEGSILPDVDFKLPRLFGNSIDEHFQILANKQSASYLDMAHELAETLPPPMPEDWVFKEGWMK